MEIYTITSMCLLVFELKLQHNLSDKNQEEGLP